MCFKSGVGMVSSYEWAGGGRRYWFEIIILLSVGVGVLVSLIVACDLVVGWVRLGFV